MNKIHLQHLKDKRKTMCGRITEEFGFSPVTARVITKVVDEFKKNPCKSCLKEYYKYIHGNINLSDVLSLIQGLEQRIIKLETQVSVLRSDIDKLQVKGK